MSRRTRKELVELEINEELEQWERDNQCRELARELHRQRRGQERGLVEPTGPSWEYPENLNQVIPLAA
jgi:hypothetical protein